MKSGRHCSGCGRKFPEEGRLRAIELGKRIKCSVCGAKTTPVDTDICAKKHKGDALDDALARVEEAANPDWLLTAIEAGRRVALLQEELTTDDIWTQLDLSPSIGTKEPRAMGAVMRKLQRSGVVENTMRQKISGREECHRRPLTVWRSLIWGGLLDCESRSSRVITRPN